MTDDRPCPVLPGERAPACFGMAADRTFYSFEEQFGRPAVLILAGADAAADLAALVAGFTRDLAGFSERNTDVLLLVDDNPRALWPDQQTRPSLRTIDCGTFLHRCDVGAKDLLVLVLDRNLRVALRAQPTQDTPAACLACLDRLPHEVPRDAVTPAPVIILPNLIDRDVCRTLIDRFDNGLTIDGEVARIDAAGVVRSVVDRNKKYRRDLLISHDDPLHAPLQDALLRRCAPEIAKAFQVNISHTDRILVARYDGSGGWFRRHRDNAAENVAFRQFAISVNLNAEEYQGGHLIFPEYNDHRYTPPTGGGLIFSTSVLHEATPVTAGCRYVLLTFFHTDAAEVQRRRYLERSEGGRVTEPRFSVVSAPT